MAATFFLLRHAVHDGPPGTLVGRSPGVALSLAGRAQAAALAARLANEGLTMVHTSPATRCRQTAEAVAAASGLPAIVTPALDEVEFGRWTGLDLATLDADPAWRHWNCNRDAASAPGGETMLAVQARVVQHMTALCLQHPAVRIALVSHAEPIKALVLHWLGLPLRSYAAIEIDPASITIIVAWPGGGKLISLNETARGRWQ